GAATERTFPPVDPSSFKLIGHNYTTQDLYAKVTGQAKYAEDFRAEGMLFCKLMLSPRPHARVVSIDQSRALAMPGVHAVLTGKALPRPAPPSGPRPAPGSVPSAAAAGGVPTAGQGQRPREGAGTPPAGAAPPPGPPQPPPIPPELALAEEVMYE